MLQIGPSDDRELAQLVERHPYKVDVAGSNPVLPTNFKPASGGIKIGTYRTLTSSEYFLKIPAYNFRFSSVAFSRC